MSSRYPPTPRDRSPPRHFDRRPSATYAPGASSYRGTGDSQASSLDRAPPRGPKADFRGGGYSFSPAPRGRGGFPPRAGDTWDRDRERERDIRNQPPPYRRDDERNDWPRRDREFPPSERNAGFPRERLHVGRDRSASPDRPRRNSKEGIAPTFNRAPESTSSYHGTATRGGSTRGRGRGDWDRSRGRSSFVSERDREFFPRSRSREDWRDRDYDRGRPSGPDGERNDRFDRRDYDRLDDRDIRPRDHDVWQRDRSPGRNSAGRPASPGAASAISQHGERYKGDYETGRKPSLVAPLSARSEGRREADSDYFSARVETPRREGPSTQQFPTPSVPQSSSIGLDYGPPPSVPATTPSVQEKPPAPKPQPTKVEPALPPTVPTAPAALQPPSGPKADRVGPPPNAPSTPRAGNQPFEQWPKTDSVHRAPRPGGTLNTAPPPINEASWKSIESPAEIRPLVVSAADRPLPANVPSGPRAASGSFRARLLSNEQTVPNAPPTAPRQPKANTLEGRAIPNAPTGPRSNTFPAPTAPHNSPPIGPQAGTNRQWVAPDYRPSKPSIMNQMNKPYQPDVRERSSISGPSMRTGGVTYQSQQSRPKITQPLSAESASHMLSARAIGTLEDTPSGAQTPMDEDMVDSPADVEMSYPASDEDDVEDDDGLDEDYFAASEETHNKEMRLLESKKPAPPFLDPVLAVLIIRVQLLGMIANEITPEAYESMKDSTDSAMDLDTAPSNAPLSPRHTPEESLGPVLEHPRPLGRPLSQAVINPIPTPPIDELPYLKEAMEGFHVFEESENETNQDHTRLLLCERFEFEDLVESENLDDLHAFYKSRYPLWRRDVEQAEQRLREVHQPSPAPASPAPSATPSLPPGPERPGGERTRGARNTTDLDMQQAILMSQQSAREEEERREREAASNALPNYETEAVVPFMLRPSEVNFNYFEDTNSMIDQELALHVYGFIPPEDDFTEEEQAAFIAAYCQHPKKWGKIADSIPGRSYQDCIIHYYLTKDKAHYKEHWRRSQPKRGRRRAANVKPRANNLMSDLALNEEGDGTPVAVTDSGRPRRAAAPTFGDVPETDTSSAAPQAKRLKENGKDNDTSQPKPRGRKGTGAGKGRKAKDKVLVDPAGQILLPAGNAEASPQKLDRTLATKEKIGRSTLKAEAIPKLEAYGAPIMSAQVPLGIGKVGPEDIATANLGQMPVQVTSYWSVPEQQKFPQLVSYFGRDFAAIANFLKTKSPIMIKNYYQRELSNGKHELEHFANIAEEKRAKGEDMGPQPAPVQPPKRRYEATPSMASMPRPVTIENQTGESDQIVSVAKPMIEDFPPNSIQRVADGVVAKPRPPRELIHHSPISAHVHPKIEESVRSDRHSLFQKQLQGPPRGIFPDEPIPYAQKPQASAQEMSPHQRPLPIVDHRAHDSRTQQVPQHTEARGPDFGRGLLPQSRDSTVQPQMAAALSQYPLQHHRLASHSRHTSLVSNNAGQSNHEQAAADLASLRDNNNMPRSLHFSNVAARSPNQAPAQPIIPSSTEHHSVRNIPPPAEPPKPAPVKRSNVFSILNADPPEPDVKRTPIETIKRSNVNTPPPHAVPLQTSLSASRHQDETLRTTQPPYSHINHINPIKQDFRQDFSSSPAPGHTDDWIGKWDPRQPTQGSDMRPAQPSPAPGPYSVVPPNSQSSPAAGLPGRYDPTRMESSTHRRSMLSMDHAPSPPPQQQQQQQQQATNLHRSSSGSSQHGRVASNSFHPSTVSGPPSYPHSTSSTPVGALHHRSQHSVDQPRQTIQQVMRERREIEIMQQQHMPSQPQPPSQPPSRMSDRREIYGSAPEPRSTQHPIPPPPSQNPQPQPLSVGYPTAPPSRTYTPPQPNFGTSNNVGGHSHHTNQQQYQPHQSHQSQYSHGPPPGPNQHHQPYPGHPSYNQPPQPLTHQRPVHTLNSNNLPPQGHYRNYSADDRR